MRARQTFQQRIRLALQRMATRWALPFLKGKGENRIGYLQKDEALCLYSLIKVLRPKTVVEFGFLEGYSAYVILSALDRDGSLYSFDNSTNAAKAAAVFTKKYPNFFFRNKNQQAFGSADVDSNTVNFVLFDASHDLTVNKATFEKLVPHLAEAAIVVVHDTGIWKREHMNAAHYACLETIHHKWLDESTVAHQADERRFVNWIVETYPAFTCLHFGSEAILRHGFTLVGRKQLLPI